MAANKTSLSAGAVIRTLLLEDPDVSRRVNKIFPVWTDNAELPYIAYRRTGLEANPQKGRPGADTVQMEIICYTARYTEGVQLAEAVRSVLESAPSGHGALTLRSCHLSGAEEAYQDDAYLQQLIFTIKL